MNDLTIIYLTINQMPQRWATFHMEHLLRAIENRPMVVISKEPMDIGRANTEYLIQSEPPSEWNVYHQLLRGSALADTKYVAVAEDDTLYTRGHFSEFRPPDDAVSYNLARWSVFTWRRRPFYTQIRRHGNFAMIGPRSLVMDAISEREDKYPEGHSVAGEIGRPHIERRLRVSRRKLVDWYSREPIVNLAHPKGLSGRGKRTGELKAWDIPIWGKAKHLAALYNRGVAEERQWSLMKH